MAPTSLYRKHRPQRFDALVGQEHVTTALRNAVRESRVGHAYLFTGPRGTGKTTTARILAKALNCAARGPDGEPCNECASCLEVATGASFDVVELDAASSNKVDDMREVLERVAYRSAGGAYKIYILDEVHMLGPGASAALLKTLEEPPEHVVFILATTDPQKVLPTIRSRAQKFDFSLMPTDTLAGLVRDVASREGVAADDETVMAIARQAAGSGRDALSLLDQALAYGNGRLDATAVRDLFGGTPFDRRASVFDAVLSEDPAAVLSAVDDVLATGTGVRQLADDLLRYLRDVFVLASGRGRVRLEATEEEQKQLLHHGETFHSSGVLRAMETIGEAVVEMRTAPDPRLVLEVALVRLARREAGTPVEALLDRVSHLERVVEELRSLAAGGPSPPAAAPAPAAAPLSARLGPKAALGGLRAPKPPSADEPVADEPSAAEPSGAAPSGAAPSGAAPAGAAPVAAAPVAAAPVAAEPAAPAEPATPDAPPGQAASAPAELNLDDVVLAWPNVLAGLGRSRLKAFAQEAQPVAVDGTAIVLGLPSKFAGVHKPTIERDRVVLCEALTKELGRPVTGVQVVLDDGFVGHHDPRPDRAASSSTGTDDPDDGIDHRELVDVPAGAEPADTIESRLIDTFGATVEDEIVRDR